MADNIKLRGKTWHLYWRVPTRYAEVESRKTLEFSLRTGDRDEAKERAAVHKTALRAQWEAMLLNVKPVTERDAYDAIVAVAQLQGQKYRPASELAKDPLHEIMERLDSIQSQPPESHTVTAALGGAPLPNILVSESSSLMERVHATDILGKTPNQLQKWKDKWLRASKALIAAAGDRPLNAITTAEARKYRDHWKEVRDAGRTTDYVNKQIGYMEQILNTYYEDLDISDHENPFRGMQLKPTGKETKTAPQAPKETPVVWIRDVLLSDEKCASLNPEARDITIVSAETGSRASEIYNLPPHQIRLKDVIPHIRIDMELEGEERREIKNTSSVRLVPLVGHALEAMQRNSEGFPRYRGKGSYSGYINKHLRERDLMPSNGVTIRGLRHTFETRLRLAGVDNEDRAMLMGHSVGKIRGRPVYGDTIELRVKALLLEMVAFPTSTWEPRTKAELSAEIHRLLEEQGFRPQ